MPVISHPRTGCRGLTSNGQSRGAACRGFGSAWWAWGVGDMTSIRAVRVGALCHRRRPVPSSLAPRWGRAAVLPHNCRRLAASSAKPIFEGTQPRARSGRLSGQVHDCVQIAEASDPICTTDPGTPRPDGTFPRIRRCPMPRLLLSWLMWYAKLIRVRRFSRRETTRAIGSRLSKSTAEVSGNQPAVPAIGRSPNA
jgi:hypothetical protein